MVYLEWIFGQVYFKSFIGDPYGCVGGDGLYRFFKQVCIGIDAAEVEKYDIMNLL